MLVKMYGSAVYGVEAITITVEVNVTEGLYTFLVGLPDNALKESIQRVESAIKTNGYYMPRTKIIINLAPAGIRKSGTAFDLPIALGILAASGQIPEPDSLQQYLITGELGLDGSIHHIKGALPIAIQAQKEGFKALILPNYNAREASVVKGLDILPFDHLSDVIAFLNGTEDMPDAAAGSSGAKVLSIDPNGDTACSDAPSSRPSRYKKAVHPDYAGSAYRDPSATFGDDLPMQDLDFSDVKGQHSIKRALEIAAAGGHNALLIGPPGVGKTMLAQRLPTILPPLTLEESLETTRVHSVAGKMPASGRLITHRPFRSPHHTISAMALVGGSSNPQPGEISLAHNGVLFLDELPEFSRNVLEVMRQPMEDRKITISRASMSVDFPANFMLLASMNPCPCGFHNHPDKECVCPPGAVFKYFNRISGPLLDRIDLHIEVTPVPHADLMKTAATGESSYKIRQRVIAAREIQGRRYTALGRPFIYCNAQINSQLMKKACRLDTEGEKMLRSAMDKLQLSARAYERILKVSRTIADLEAAPEILTKHLAEAIQYRSLDRDSWML